MEIKINPLKYYKGLFLICVSLFLGMYSICFGQDQAIGINQNSSASTIILSIAANVRADRMSISYDGLSSRTGLLFGIKKNRYGNDPLKTADPEFEISKKKDKSFKPERILKQITCCFLKYFNIDNFTTDNAGLESVLQNMVNIDKTAQDDFAVNLSFNIGSDNDTLLKMDALKLESQWMHTYVNAVYHYGKKEVEIGFSNTYLNDFLLEGMKLELMANPGTGSGAVFLTMGL